MNSFETKRPVREQSAVRAVHEAFDVDPGVGHMAAHNERTLWDSCVEASAACGLGQQAIVLSALAEAAGLIREQAAWCRDCEMAPAALCGDHAGALARAGEYDRFAVLLRGQP